MEMSKFIHHCAKTDYALKCCVGENDLIAYKAHYHKSCKIAANKKAGTKVSHGKVISDPHKQPFEELVRILQHGFLNGSVYSMDNVCAKYSELLGESSETATTLRTHHLKNKLISHFGDKICFCRQRTMNQPLLLLPNVSWGETVEALKHVTDTLQEKETMDFSKSAQPHIQTFMQSLNHVASTIHADLKATQGYCVYDNLGMESAESGVPDSLYILVKWILTQKNMSLPRMTETTKRFCTYVKILCMLHQMVIRIH